MWMLPREVTMRDSRFWKVVAVAALAVAALYVTSPLWGPAGSPGAPYVHAAGRRRSTSLTLRTRRCSSTPPPTVRVPSTSSPGDTTALTWRAVPSPVPRIFRISRGAIPSRRCRSLPGRDRRLDPSGAAGAGPQGSASAPVPSCGKNVLSPLVSSSSRILPQSVRRARAGDRYGCSGRLPRFIARKSRVRFMSWRVHSAE